MTTRGPIGPPRSSFRHSIAGGLDAGAGYARCPSILGELSLRHGPGVPNPALRSRWTTLQGRGIG